ncbi:MAG: lamin tail domain-containing protein, partial [Pigmentiphaga sp.]
FYALQGTVIENLTDGNAGVISEAGEFLASLTLGGPAGDIPASLIEANAAFAFTVDPSNQTNARYAGSLDTSSLEELAARIADPELWDFNTIKAPGFSLTDGGFFNVPLLSRSEVAGDSLTLTWNQPLDALNLPALEAFEVEINGVAVAVSSLEVAGDQLHMTLAEVVEGGDLVSLNYNDPSGQDDDDALQSLNGHDVPGFTIGAISNLSPDSEAPTVQAWEIDSIEDQAMHFAPLVVTFDEIVLKGEGQIVFARQGVEDETIVIDVASSEVSIVGNQVTIDPLAVLEAGAAYSVTIAAGAFRDAAGNQHAGILDDNAWSFETVARPAYELLITEVNSNGGTDDFFEILNFGAEVIDLSAWGMIDENGKFASAVRFAEGTTLEAGEAMVVVLTDDAADVAAFRQAWNLDEDVNLVGIDGPGLGKGDAVVLFDTDGYVAAAFNYGASAVATSDDGSWEPSAPGGTGAAKFGEHAGLVFGGKAGDSAVWDGLSLTAPTYVAAAAGDQGGYANGNDGALGSPGIVPDGWTELTEGWLIG